MRYVTFYNVENSGEVVFEADVGYDEEKKDLVLLRGDINTLHFLNHLKGIDDKGQFDITKDKKRYFDSFPGRFGRLSRMVVSNIKED